MKIILKLSFFIVLLLSPLSCGPHIPFVWVDTLSIDEHKATPYVIEPGDSIEVVVWDQPQISGNYTVREDGYITVPLLGDLYVAKRTTEQTAKIIGEKLEGDIVQDVRVVAIARNTVPKFVSVLGEVGNPGQYTLKPGDTMLDVIAMAGGLTEFADKDSIYLLRRNSRTPRVRFDYDRLTSSKRGGIRFQLQNGDIIVVE